MSEPRSAGHSWREPAVALLVSVAFAASFGFNFGWSNQLAYFLPAVRRLDPTLFQRDWLLTQTTDYHGVFAYVGAFLLSLDAQGWGVALAFTLAATTGLVSLFFLLRQCLGPRPALASFLLLATVAFLTGTRGPATTYVFDGTLQPSTASAGLLLVAVPLFVAGRYLGSGLFLALAGLLHVNVLVLALGAFSAAHVFLARERLLPRLVRQLAPALLVLAASSPLLVRGVAGGADAELARAIYLHVRAPHHFELDGRWDEFLPFVAWALMGFTALRSLSREGAPYRSFAALAAGFASVVTLGVVATLFSERARVLFSWRLTAHTELLLQAATLAWVVRLLLEPARPPSMTPPATATMLAGLGLALFAYARSGPTGLASLLAMLVLAIAAFVSVVRTGAFSVDGKPPASWGRRWATHGPTILTLSSAVLLVSFATPSLTRIRRHSTLLGHASSSAAPLFDWIRANTARDAVLLTPPDLDGVRFFAQRAIVVDWKCNPGIPLELLDWYRRLLDVTGLRELRSEADLGAYDTLDATRLGGLVKRYGIDYVVVRRGKARELAYPRAYEDREFTLFRLTPALSR